MGKVPKVNLRPPVGEAYAQLEGARGLLGMYIVSDGGLSPYRLAFAGPLLYQFGDVARNFGGLESGRRGGDFGIHRYRFGRGGPIMALMASGPWAVTGPWVPSQLPESIRGAMSRSLIVLAAILFPLLGLTILIGEPDKYFHAAHGFLTKFIGHQIPAWIGQAVLITVPCLVVSR
jgi:hypothetical protein